MGNAKKSKHEPSLRCTACDTDLKNAGVDVLRKHALLGVLTCKKCFENYGDGDFTKYENGVDEEGDDNYCRWCADGGDLLVCCSTNCHYAYCKKCIKRNLGRKIYTAISESEDWKCFACEKDQISAWIQFADDMIAKLQKNGKENEEPEVSEVPIPELVKTSILMTPSPVTSTPVNRKKEARAKKSTSKLIRVCEALSDDEEKMDESTKKSDAELEVGTVSVTKEKEKEKKKVDEEEDKQLSIAKHEKNNADITVDEWQDTEQPPTPKLEVEKKEDPRTPRASSPKKQTQIFSDITVEESEDVVEELSPKRKLCDDVVIEEDEAEDPKDKKNDESSKIIMSTTIEKANDDSDLEFSSLFSEAKSPLKRKAFEIKSNTELKKRRVTRGSVADGNIADVNGEKKVGKVNIAVNAIIHETSDLMTDYVNILSKMRDMNHLTKESVSKVKEMTLKLTSKFVENSWTIDELN